MTESTGQALLEEICRENLGVYRVSPTRLQEDVSQESQISNDYRGRLVYELLQNADDAMTGQSTLDDRITVRLTDDALWVGNSGRPLNESDVKGLCGIGASSKGKVKEKRRASIGHKGMGFKSVLEVTAAPQVISENYAFRMAPEVAHERVARLMKELNRSTPDHVPIMRFPAPLSAAPSEWSTLRAAGVRTLFCFPLRPELTAEQRDLLAQRLLTLPVTAILFLKHLEHVEVEVETEQRHEGFLWRISRELRADDTWKPCTGLTESGTYRISIETGAGEAHDFLLAHDADVQIGSHRGGLDAYGWDGIEISEVSVAALIQQGRPTPLPTSWRKFHVFLPTSEPCPYPLLVNGAFVSDLSRQEIRIGESDDDYNSFLLKQAAALLRDVLAPQAEEAGADVHDVLRLLDRSVSEPGVEALTAAGQALFESMRAELSWHPFLPAADGRLLALDECVVPPLVSDKAVGAAFRNLLEEDAIYEGRQFPDASLCSSAPAHVLVDHGAHALTAQEAATVLGTADLSRVPLAEHPSGGVLVDPVLTVLQGLWEGMDGDERDALVEGIRRESLFPVGLEDGIVQRVVTEEVACFYPPRSLRGKVPLKGLSFLMQDLCWGALTPTERNQLLKDEQVAWQALFELREFKFPDVMRASVLPALELDQSEDTKSLLDSLKEMDALAAICQLAGRAPDQARPLRYERLGSNRALFNLSRLPMPCRSGEGSEIVWRPAYKVYFGSDWVGEASIECVLDATRQHSDDVPDIPLLAGPEVFDGLLNQFQHLREAAEDSTADEDEVSLDEDEDAPPDQIERDRWLEFLMWVGVNRVLRPVHFHDVEDRGTGWLTTRDFAQPDGWAFASLPAETWDAFRQQAVRGSAEKVSATAGTPYLYRVHDLEHVVPLLKAAAADADANVARALFSHLALNWPYLERFARAEAAVVPAGSVPNMRAKPPRARDEELVGIGDDLWVRRLQEHDWCPTTHGPRRPGRAWLRTAEVERRFGRQGSDAGSLLPLLDTEPTLVQGRARGFLHLLGVRVELTPSSFNPDDARTLLDQLRNLYAAATAAGELAEQSLRQVIRPAYRNLVELLPGADASLSPAYARGTLRGSPLLVHDGDHSYRFDPSEDVLYVDRPSTRERLGAPDNLWTFILEARPGARGPLTTLLGVRVLEEQITWTPRAGDPPFDDDDLEQFREGIRKLAPYVLARLGVERQEERQASEDKRRLQAFVESARPVTELSVSARIGDRDIGATITRDAFVDVGPRGTVTAFIRWGESPWPPTTPEEAEALATALADTVESGHLEAFLALINARSKEGRLKLLRLAGASLDLEAVWNLEGAESPAAEPPEAPETLKTPGETPTEQPATQPTQIEQQGQRFKTPLFRPDQLLVEGEPVVIAGDGRGAPVRHRRSGGSGASKQDGGTAGYGGQTDLNELDRLGMHVAMTYERSRLRRSGVGSAEIFSVEAQEMQQSALVFDVSTLEALDDARERSASFREAFAHLEREGVSLQAPGFDILTMNPQRPNGIDRIIELKSSGVAARLQEMSWNEWKSAQNSSLRRHYYLYLVGNLRSDLGDAVPFIRTVRDPFEAIWAEEVDHESRSRKIQLHVSRFTAAEHLDLVVVHTDDEAQPTEASAAS